MYMSKDTPVTRPDIFVVASQVDEPERFLGPTAQPSYKMVMSPFTDDVATIDARKVAIYEPEHQQQSNSSVNQSRSK